VVAECAQLNDLMGSFPARFATYQPVRSRFAQQKRPDPIEYLFPIPILPPVLETLAHRMSALDMILFAQHVIHEDSLFCGRRVLIAETTPRFSWPACDIIKRELDGLGG
jgi:hypothetical protein